MQDNMIGQKDMNLRELLDECGGGEGSHRKAMIAGNKRLASKIKWQVAKTCHDTFWGKGYADTLLINKSNKIVFDGKAKIVTACPSCIRDALIRLRIESERLDDEFLFSSSESHMQVHEEAIEEALPNASVPSFIQSLRANTILYLVDIDDNGNATIKVGLYHSSNGVELAVKVVSDKDPYITNWLAHRLHTSINSAIAIKDALNKINKQIDQAIKYDRQEKTEPKNQIPQTETKPEPTETKSTNDQVELPKLKRGMTIDNGEFQAKIWSFSTDPIVARDSEGAQIEISFKDFNSYWVIVPE